MARKRLIEQVIERDPYLHADERFLMGDLQLFAGMIRQRRELDAARSPTAATTTPGHA